MVVGRGCTTAGSLMGGGASLWTGYQGSNLGSGSVRSFAIALASESPASSVLIGVAPIQETMGNQLAPGPPFLSHLQTLHVVVVGLDSAGKTSLLYRMKFQEFVKSAPTKGFNMEKIRVPLGGSRAITFQVWDVGGQEKLRPLWKSYMRRTDGVVFVVDSAEADRLEEARVELHRIVRSSDNQGVPVLVLANKQDSTQALSVAEIEKLLGLHELCASTLNHLQGCSAVTGLGLHQGLEKLYEMILKRKKLLRTSKKKR